MGEKVNVYKNNFIKIDLSKDFNDSRLIIKELYENSLKLHEYIEEKYNNLESIFTVNNIVNRINIDEDGVITGWSEISWSIDIINNINTIIENILFIKTKVNLQSDFTLKENVLLELSNDVLIEFCNKQNMFKLLNNILNLCSKCDINKLDGLIFDLSKISQEKANKSLQVLKKYNYNLNELKLNLV